MKMSEIKFDDTVDITDVVCPVTFVKAKVALEELDEGQRYLCLYKSYRTHNICNIYRIINFNFTHFHMPPGFLY